MNSNWLQSLPLTQCCHEVSKDARIPGVDNIRGLMLILRIRLLLSMAMPSAENSTKFSYHRTNYTCTYINLVFNLMCNPSTNNSMAVHEWKEAARLYEVNEDKLGYCIELVINVVYLINHANYCDSLYSQLYPTQFVLQRFYRPQVCVVWRKVTFSVASVHLFTGGAISLHHGIGTLLPLTLGLEIPLPSCQDLKIPVYILCPNNCWQTGMVGLWL